MGFHQPTSDEVVVVSCSALGRCVVPGSLKVQRGNEVNKSMGMQDQCRSIKVRESRHSS